MPSQSEQISSSPYKSNTLSLYSQPTASESTKQNEPHANLSDLEKFQGQSVQDTNNDSNKRNSPKKTRGAQNSRGLLTTLLVCHYHCETQDTCTGISGVRSNIFFFDKPFCKHICRNRSNIPDNAK